jgi:8-oxo-dGTP pyrophosphatase MutT (NUDIX family)
MKKTVDTVSLILIREGKVFVESRRPDKATYPGAVVIPGGHVEEAESYTDTYRRELKEELDLACARFIIYDRILCITDVEDQMNRGYTCEWWAGDPRCIEASGTFWIGRDEVSRLDQEEDRRVISRLFAGLTL